MHSTNVRQIKAALMEQAFHGTTQVSCLLGRVVAVSRWKGQLRVMILGWPRWYPVESVCIEGAGPQLFGGLCVPLLAYPGLPSTGRMSVEGCDTS